MKVETSKVVRVRGTELKGLDPITIYLEDFKPGEGKIIIECYGKSWSSYWYGMGRDNTVATFFITTGVDYLIGCLSPHLQPVIQVEEDDYDIIKEALLKGLEGREGEEAQDLREEIKEAIWPDWDYYAEKVFGDDGWHGDLPTKPNPAYEHLSRVITVTKEILLTLPPKRFSTLT